MEQPDGSLQALLERHAGASRDSLIPILQQVQARQGWLSREDIAAIGTHLGLPASKVYGVATFYNQFRFQPRGRWHVMLCRGTACHVKGSKRLLEAVERTLGIGPGQTDRQRIFSLEVVACMGACGLSPVVNINGEFYAKVTPARLARILDDCRKRDAEVIDAAT